MELKERRRINVNRGNEVRDCMPIPFSLSFDSFFILKEKSLVLWYMSPESDRRCESAPCYFNFPLFLCLVSSTIGGHVEIEQINVEIKQTKKCLFQKKYLGDLLSDSI